MLGGAINRKASANTPIIVHHTAEVTCKAGGVVPKPVDPITKKEMTPTASADHPIRLINLTTGTRTQLTTGSIDGTKVITFKNPKLIDATGNTEDTASGDKIRIFWEEVLTGANTDVETAVEVTISPNTFPGQYRVVGDTFMRSQATGKDEPFQFVINNAKVQSSVTITLEAEGDPSTFDLNLTVLRSGDEMMKLVRYSVGNTGSGTAEDDIGSISEP